MIGISTIKSSYCFFDYGISLNHRHWLSVDCYFEEFSPILEIEKCLRFDPYIEQKLELYRLRTLYK